MRNIEVLYAKAFRAWLKSEIKELEELLENSESEELYKYGLMKEITALQHVLQMAFDASHHVNISD